jgi:outer membrane receptor protein involved in Fe transport
MKQNKLSLSIKAAIALTSASLLLTNPVSAFVGAETAEENIERISVTGSRIQRSTASTPTPTTILDAAQIKQLGFSNAGDILNSLPAFSESIGRAGADTTDGQSGLELPNLRGLGTARTLVLVNGRRHVGSEAGNSAVDVSTIPSQLIERVEVITGAASAVYGADAVSGVVNFIMKSEFDGVQVNAEYGESSEGDGEEKVFSILAGTSFDQGRGNILVSLDYTDRGAVRAQDRKQALRGAFWKSNLADTGPNDGNPANILSFDRTVNPLNDAGIVSPNGFGFQSFDAVNGIPVLGYGDIGSLPAQTFDANGNAIDFEIGDCIIINCTGGMGFNPGKYDVLSLASERSIFSLVTNYELSDSHQLFADVKYSHTIGENSNQPSFSDNVFGPALFVGRDNPYLNEYPTISNAMDGAGLDHVIVHKAQADLGQSATENTFKLYQIVAGANGDLTEDITYDFYVQHGQSKSTIIRQDRITSKFLQAQDAISDGSGNIVCRDSSGGCAPINPFGLHGASAEAADFIMTDIGLSNKLEQTVASFSISGDVTELPAGFIQFAAGLEYREEKSESVPDDLLLIQGLTANTQEGPRKIVKGQYDVKEIFAEIRIPLLADVDFAKELSFETAVRYSDYSTVGGQTAYKLGLDWAINDSLRARSSYGVAVRAPNAGELFTPENLNWDQLIDPCSATNINEGVNPSKRAANCQSLGMPAGFTALDGATTKIFVSGNKDLDAEESESLTIGLVYTPQWTDNLSVGVDYWEITIDEAIATIEGADILTSCFDFEMDGNPYCDLIARDSSFAIDRVNSQYINTAEFTAKGYDFEANYQLDMKSSGSVLFNLVGSYYIERDVLINPSDPSGKISQIDVVDNPKTRVNLNMTYNLENWTAHLGLSYIGSSKIAHGNPEDNDPIYSVANKVDAVVYANARGSYRFDENLDVYFGIKNITDKAPQLLTETYKGSGLYDNIGRSYYLGVNYSF